MDLNKYRASASEQKRTGDLLRLVRLIPDKGEQVLDIGSRDGHFSTLLTGFYKNVTALDLEKPAISHEQINCVQGDIIDLKFSDNTFDLVFCAEVLEHIPSHLLSRACSEISRISMDYLLIGVPYKQDIRVGRTTCYTCMGKNPPWGHVNRFDKNKLKRLFPLFNIAEVSFVEQNKLRTNFISAFFMDLAGNPRGTYNQDESCIHCGMKLLPPPQMTVLQKGLMLLAIFIRKIQQSFYKSRPSWIHVLFIKQRRHKV